MIIEEDDGEGALFQPQAAAEPVAASVSKAVFSIYGRDELEGRE
jgi:hypothetical protein